MSHEPQQPKSDSSPESAKKGSSASSTRRDVLKKGAIIGAVAGAVWSAPIVENLSVVPDYASAGTVSGVGPIIFKLVGFNDPGFTDGVKAVPSPEYTINNPGPSKSQTVQMTAPLGVAGDATLTFPEDSDVDDGPFSTTVTFDVDPPYNKCRIVSGQVDWSGDGPGFQPLSVTNVPVPNNTSPSTATLTSPVAPGGTNGVNNIEVSIECQ